MGAKDRMGKELVEGSNRTATWQLGIGGKDAGIMRVDMNNMEVRIVRKARNLLGKNLGWLRPLADNILAL